jgi:hypothetical protein
VSRKATICLAIAVLAQAGCGGGGALSEQGLQKQAEAVQSLAAEGALVAQGAQEDRTTDTFVRVHTEYLAKAAAKVESALDSAHATGRLDARRARAERLALLVSNDLDRLHRHPGDRALAARVKSALERHAVTAEALAK